MFATFKQEMNKMSKTIKKLEKENTSWKGKHEQVSKSMFTMAEEVGVISNISNTPNIFDLKFFSQIWEILRLEFVLLKIRLNAKIIFKSTSARQLSTVT